MLFPNTEESKTKSYFTGMKLIPLWPRKNRNHKFKMGETQKCKSQLAARLNLHIHLITCCIISATTDFTFISILRRTLQWSSHVPSLFMCPMKQLGRRDVGPLCDPWTEQTLSLLRKPSTFRIQKVHFLSLHKINTLSSNSRHWSGTFQTGSKQYLSLVIQIKVKIYFYLET